MGAEAGPAVRVQIGEAVDHEQGHPGQAVKRCAQRRELAQVELAWPVELDVRHQFNAVSYQAEEAQASADTTAAARAPPDAR